MPDLRGITWLSGFPKSGNTWLRLLLEAYRCNGALDINDVRICSSDGGAIVVQGVSPMPLDALGFRGEALLRPAALLNLVCRMTPPIMLKTHWVNVQPEGLPPFIPKEFTFKAVHVVRDPRSIVSSFASFFGFSLEKAVATMASKDFTIGGHNEHSRTMVSGWSNHVASWIGETEFPVHIVRYEDLLVDAGKELTEVLEFLEYDVDEKRIDRAVKATELSKLQQFEKKNGFKESIGKNGSFFGKGGTRWQDELGPKWVEQIEEDHRQVMEAVGYLDAPKLQAVK